MSTTFFCDAIKFSGISWSQTHSQTWLNLRIYSSTYIAHTVNLFKKRNFRCVKIRLYQFVSNLVFIEWQFDLDYITIMWAFHCCFENNDVNIIVMTSYENWAQRKWQNWPLHKKYVSFQRILRKKSFFVGIWTDKNP